MATSNKKNINCHFGSRCNNGDSCKYAHPEREANSSPFALPPKCDTKGKVTSRPQSHSRRPRRDARDSSTTRNSTPNSGRRTNSRNSRPNSKIRHSHPIESIDYSSLSFEQIKKKIQDQYEVQIIKLELFNDIYKIFYFRKKSLMRVNNTSYLLPNKNRYLMILMMRK